MTKKDQQSVISGESCKIPKLGDLSAHASHHAEEASLQIMKIKRTGKEKLKHKTEEDSE